MYAKFFAIAALVSAVVSLPGGTTPQISQCNVGTVRCCETLQNSNHSDVRQAFENGVAGGLLGDIDIDGILNGLTVQAALNCDPISVIGLGGNSCSAQPVCCTGNNFGTVVALGCNPINANL